jgi:putative SOS response-associated peptidase YedK
MCGRYTLAITYRELAEELGVAFDPAVAEAYRPRYNIAPTDGNLVLCEQEGDLSLVPARFGLVNFWAKDLSGAARQINARAETVRERPAFREAFEKRRCIVPADGFYEWKREGKAKLPIWFHPSEGKLLRFAGLYDTWKDRATGQRLRTFAIITTGANELVGPVHDRMPAILAPEDAEVWLSAAPSEAFALLRPAPEGALEAKRVSQRVGNVRNDDPSLLVADEPASAGLPLFERAR